MVFLKIDRAITRFTAPGIFLFLWCWVGVACAPNVSVATPPVTPTAIPTWTRTPTAASPCSLIQTPIADNTPIVHPTFVPVPTLSAKLPTVIGRSALIETKFFSPALGKDMPMLVYLPPGYFDTARRYPTLYMLSGFAGDEREWADWGMCDALELLIRGGRIPPMIVVMPNGDHSWWFNHANVPGSDGKPYGDYVWRDVVGYVDASYRTEPTRARRAIGGLSAGGQGALMLALTHPEVFSIAGAHSPSVRGADGSLPFFGDPAYFQQYDLVWLMENTQTWRTLTFWIDVGANDQQWGAAIIRFHTLLDSLAIPHEFHDDWIGIHDDYYWSAHIPDYLVWYSDQLAKP